MRPGPGMSVFFEEHIEANALYGSKGLALVEKYCDTPELRQQTVDAVHDATVRRWRYMNGIKWFVLHGKDDDTPPLSRSGDSSESVFVRPPPPPLYLSAHLSCVLYREV